MAQPLTATHTTVTNMTRRAEGVEKEGLFPPVRPDGSQQLHPFIFFYWQENITQISESTLSVRCWMGLGMSHDHPGLQVDQDLFLATSADWTHATTNSGLVEILSGDVACAYRGA